MEVYDPATDTWAEQTELPSPRVSPVASVVDGIIYTIGGKSSELGYLVEAYNPATDTWTRKADMPTLRYFHSGCAINGKIYVMGGWTTGGLTASVEEYDPMTDTWTVKTPMSTHKCFFGTCVIDGKICAIGGWRGSDTITTVEVYDTQTDTWTSSVDIPIPTDGMSTSVIGENIYVMGGWSSPTGLYIDGTDTLAVYVSEVIVDFNGDEVCDIDDLVIMIENWGTDNTLCDIGPMPWGDGVVDQADVEVLMRYWGQEIYDPKLIAHWKLNETEGNIAYDSEGQNDGTLHGDPIWQPQGGILNGALELDGIDDYISTQFIINPAKIFSVFAWVKGGAPGQVIVSQKIGANWLMLDQNTGCLMTELKASASRGGHVLTSQVVIADGFWHRIGFVWDGTNRILYVDDAEVASDTQDGIFGSNGGLFIGAENDLESGTLWSGLIDDVRIYNRAVKP